MVPCFGTHGSGQRIKNKPISVGYKIWVLVEKYEYVIQFDPYQEAKPEKQIASKTRWGLGEMVVLCLMEGLTPNVNYHILMDKYFGSFWLLVHLGEHDARQCSTRQCSISAQLRAMKLWK